MKGEQIVPFRRGGVGQKLSQRGPGVVGESGAASFGIHLIGEQMDPLRVGKAMEHQPVARGIKSNRHGLPDPAGGSGDQYGFQGYPKLKGQKKNMQPSDYFRCIADDMKSYLFTGEQAKKLREVGKSVGQEQQICKARRIQNSFDLQVAKRNYGFTIANYIRSTKLRLRETFDSITKQKVGKPVELNIHMTSNGKYAQSNFKMYIDKITFSPINS